MLDYSSDEYFMISYYFKIEKRKYNVFYTTLTNFSTKYLVMCKVFTDVGGIK